MEALVSGLTAKHDMMSGSSSISRSLILKEDRASLSPDDTSDLLNFNLMTISMQQYRYSLAERPISGQLRNFRGKLTSRKNITSIVLA